MYRFNQHRMHCNSLESLIVSDKRRSMSLIQLRTVFDTAKRYETLTELTVDVPERCRWAAPTAQIETPPRLRYLHVRTHRIEEHVGVQHPEVGIKLPATLTHLALVLDMAQGQSLIQKIDAQRLPHLTHCHIGCANPMAIPNSGWRSAIHVVKEELGPVWCEKEEDVVRWRVDRVWRRSVATGRDGGVSGMSVMFSDDSGYTNSVLQVARSLYS